jgi:FtsP/CotA-like multicopper oxidase with cupredoxin domain
MRRLSLSLIAAFSVLTGSAHAQIPANLFPAPGAVLIGQFPASGVQIYQCSLVGSALQWTFVAPRATLVNAQNQVFAQHYAGPTWEATDGSKVVGQMMQSAPSPIGAIPWLLLSGMPSGNGVLSGTRFIQRLNTVGGALSGGCSPSGSQQEVNYTADYVFFR